MSGRRNIRKTDLVKILTNLVPSTAKELNLSEDTEEKTIEIIKRAEEEGITQGKNPNSILAAAIYIAATETGEWRSQVEVAQASGVSKSMLYKRYQEFSDGLDI